MRGIDQLGKALDRSVREVERTEIEIGMNIGHGDTEAGAGVRGGRDTDIGGTVTAVGDGGERAVRQVEGETSEVMTTETAEKTGGGTGVVVVVTGNVENVIGLGSMMTGRGIGEEGVGALLGRGALDV